MTPDQYCAQKAAPRGSALHYAARLASAQRRRALVAVHAFCREVAEVATEVADARVARLKLAWWRAELASAFDGRPQHPVAQALAPVIAAWSLPREAFAAIIDGVAMDAEPGIFRDFAALEACCAGVAGARGALSAQILGCSARETVDAARELGVARRLTSIVRDLGADLRRGRIYVPSDELERFGVTPNDLLDRRASGQFAALMTHQARRVRQLYAHARALLPAPDRRAQRPLIALAAMSEALLDEIEGEGFPVLDRRIALTPLAKAWIAWKISWPR